MIYSMQSTGHSSYGEYHYNFFTATSKEEAERLVVKLYAHLLEFRIGENLLARSMSQQIMEAIDISVEMPAEEAITTMKQYVREVQTNSLTATISLIQD